MSSRPWDHPLRFLELVFSPIYPDIFKTAKKACPRIPIKRRRDKKNGRHIKLFLHSASAFLYKMDLKLFRFPGATIVSGTHDIYCNGSLGRQRVLWRGDENNSHEHTIKGNRGTIGRILATPLWHCFPHKVEISVRITLQHAIEKITNSKNIKRK